MGNGEWPMRKLNLMPVTFSRHGCHETRRRKKKKQSNTQQEASLRMNKTDWNKGARSR
jgi:hypothetical protein